MRERKRARKRACDEERGSNREAGKWRERKSENFLVAHQKWKHIYIEMPEQKRIHFSVRCCRLLYVQLQLIYSVYRPWAMYAVFVFMYTDAELFNAPHPYCIAVEHIGRLLDGVWGTSLNTRIVGRMKDAQLDCPTMCDGHMCYNCIFKMSAVPDARG